MKAENILFLKSFNADVYKKCKEVEETIDKSSIKVDTAKSKAASLYIEKEDYSLRIHSSHDPEFEASKVLEQYKDIDKYEHILFIGSGLGYQIEQIKKQFPYKRMHIYESSVEVFYHYLNAKILPHKSIESIYVGNEEAEINAFISSVIKKSSKNVLLIDIPSYKNIFKKEHTLFLELFKKQITDNRSLLHTNYAFQKRWIINSMMNFKEVLNTPNILLEAKDKFKGKTAVLVSAGPSLDEEIENLRYIKENKLAYIFSVGSAINTLIEHDIYPHAVCTYDPGETNYKVFSKMIEFGLTDIPMIFGSSVGFTTLQKYEGPKLHMITSQDTVSRYYMNNHGNSDKIVSDAPSIAVVSLELLYKLGFSNVILVGQNLAYRGGSLYAKGINYYEDKNNVNIQQQKGLIKVKDVYGNEVFASHSFNSMRLQMEKYIEKFKDLKVYNTTKGGANIKGAVFKELLVVTQELLKEEIDGEGILSIKKTLKNDREYLNQRKESMIKEYDEISRKINDLEEMLCQFDKLIKNNNFNQIERLYTVFNKIYLQLKNNHYSKMFILPFIRTQISILEQEISLLNGEKKKSVKAKQVRELFYKVLDIFKSARKTLDGSFENLQQTIEKFLQSEDLEDINSCKKELLEIH
jgi:hypothetical protein